MINEMLSRVMDGFDIPNNHQGVKNHERTVVSGERCTRQPKQPLGTQKSSTNYCHVRQLHSAAQTGIWTS